MTATIIGVVLSLLSFILVWRWNVLESRVKKLEQKIKTLENILRNVRANQITQRENTPAKRPTIRNRELMQLGRNIQTGAVDKEIKRISKDD